MVGKPHYALHQFNVGIYTAEPPEQKIERDSARFMATCTVVFRGNYTHACRERKLRYS